jgi:hypothetical protein
VPGSEARTTFTSAEAAVFPALHEAFPAARPAQI